LFDVINHPNCLLFADDGKVYRAINSTSDCLLLQSDIDCVHEWCSANFMKPNFSKSKLISFTGKTNGFNYQYRLGNSFTLRTDCIKYLGVHIDCTLHFHHHVCFLFSHAMKLLGLVHIFMYCFSTIDSLLMQYFALVGSKLEYASVAWNTVAVTDSNELAALCHKRCQYIGKMKFADTAY
jgi:hypothetical protein